MELCMTGCWVEGIKGGHVKLEGWAGNRSECEVVLGGYYNTMGIVQPDCHVWQEDLPRDARWATMMDGRRDPLTCAELESESFLNAREGDTFVFSVDDWRKAQ